MSKSTKTKVCIIIPAYNEEATIGSVVSATKKLFKAHDIDTTIVVVNDASHDKTRQIAEKNGAVVINHILNSGAGGATATGLLYAKKNKFDIAATMDADGQHDTKDVLRGIQYR